MKTSLLATLLALLVLATTARAEKAVGPWNLDALYQTPSVTWGEKSAQVTEVYYQGEPYRGQETRVFGYYARPAQGQGPFPAMVLIHGGGGTAFAEWAELWAKRGYVALAMDLAGCGPQRKRLTDGGPGQSSGDKFPEFDEDGVRDVWTYHAIAAVVRANSLLASQEEVDADRIGLTGISWGGYLTCIAAGVDSRFKVAVPVYGCGFLNDNSAWKDNALKKLSPESRQRWLKLFDPSQYLSRVKCPILFVNGTNDFAYPLDSYQKSYRAVPGEIDLCIRVRMSHSHPAGWAPQEIGRYVDGVLKDAPPLPQLEALKQSGDLARAAYASKLPIKEAQLHYAVAEGLWNKREWKSAPAKLSGDQVTAQLPSERPLVYYLTVTDNTGCLVSTPHVVLGEEK